MRKTVSLIDKAIYVKTDEKKKIVFENYFVIFNDLNQNSL